MNIFRNFAAKSNDKATMAKQKPKDELTTEMHYEFLEDMGVDRKSFMIYSASGMIERTGCSKEEACRKHGITVKEYDENIDRVLHTDDWWGDGEVKTTNKMETIFDHGVTEKEVVALCGYLVDKTDFIGKKDQDSHNATIYRLYLMRGDKSKAMEYFNKLPNTLGKWFSLGNHCLQ